MTPITVQRLYPIPERAPIIVPDEPDPYRIRISPTAWALITAVMLLGGFVGASLVHLAPDSRSHSIDNATFAGRGR
jgi:hypothetical protein